MRLQVKMMLLLQANQSKRQGFLQKSVGLQQQGKFLCIASKTHSYDSIPHFDILCYTSFMSGALKIFVVLCIIMVTFGLPILLQQVISPGGRSTTTLTPTPTETETSQDVRYISVPPELVAPGSVFIYKVLATSNEGNDVSISIQSKPEWLVWDTTTQQLKGTVPTVGGVFTVTIRTTSTSGDSLDQTFTVTIDSQSQVKGAKTVALWTDPFHPNIQQGRVGEVIPEVTDTVSAQLVYPSVEVLGATDIAKPVVSTEVILLLVLGASVVAGLMLLITRMVKLGKTSKMTLSTGVVIERGGR